MEKNSNKDKNIPITLEQEINSLNKKSLISRYMRGEQFSLNSEKDIKILNGIKKTQLTEFFVDNDERYKILFANKDKFYNGEMIVEYILRDFIEKNDLKDKEKLISILDSRKKEIKKGIVMNNSLSSGNISEELNDFLNTVKESALENNSKILNIKKSTQSQILKLQEKEEELKDILLKKEDSVAYSIDRKISVFENNVQKEDKDLEKKVNKDIYNIELNLTKKDQKEKYKYEDLKFKAAKERLQKNSDCAKRIIAIHTEALIKYGKQIQKINTDTKEAISKSLLIHDIAIKEETVISVKSLAKEKVTKIENERDIFVKEERRIVLKEQAEQTPSEISFSELVSKNKEFIKKEILSIKEKIEDMVSKNEISLPSIRNVDDEFNKYTLRKWIDLLSLAELKISILKERSEYDIAKEKTFDKFNSEIEDLESVDDFTSKESKVRNHLEDEKKRIRLENKVKKINAKQKSKEEKERIKNEKKANADLLNNSNEKESLENFDSNTLNISEENSNIENNLSPEEKVSRSDRKKELKEQAKSKKKASRQEYNELKRRLKEKSALDQEELDTNLEIEERNLIDSTSEFEANLLKLKEYKGKTLLTNFNISDSEYLSKNNKEVVETIDISINEIINNNETGFKKKSSNKEEGNRIEISADIYKHSIDSMKKIISNDSTKEQPVNIKVKLNKYDELVNSSELSKVKVEKKEKNKLDNSSAYDLLINNESGKNNSNNGSINSSSKKSFATKNIGKKSAYENLLNSTIENEKMIKASEGTNIENNVHENTKDSHYKKEETVEDNNIKTVEDNNIKTVEDNNIKTMEDKNIHIIEDDDVKKDYLGIDFSKLEGEIDNIGKDSENENKNNVDISKEFEKLTNSNKETVENEEKADSKDQGTKELDSNSTDFTKLNSLELHINVIQDKPQELISEENKEIDQETKDQETKDQETKDQETKDQEIKDAETKALEAKIMHMNPQVDEESKENIKKTISDAINSSEAIDINGLHLVNGKLYDKFTNKEVNESKVQYVNSGLNNSKFIKDFEKGDTSSHENMFIEPEDIDVDFAKQTNLNTSDSFKRDEHSRNFTVANYPELSFRDKKRKLKDLIIKQDTELKLYKSVTDRKDEIKTLERIHIMEREEFKKGNSDFINWIDSSNIKVGESLESIRRYFEEHRKIIEENGFSTKPLTWEDALKESNTSENDILLDFDKAKIEKVSSKRNRKKKIKEYQKKTGVIFDGKYNKTKETSPEDSNKKENDSDEDVSAQIDDAIRADKETRHSFFLNISDENRNPEAEWDDFVSDKDIFREISESYDPSKQDSVTTLPYISRILDSQIKVMERNNFDGMQKGIIDKSIGIDNYRSKKRNKRKNEQFASNRNEVELDSTGRKKIESDTKLKENDPDRLRSVDGDSSNDLGKVNNTKGIKMYENPNYDYSDSMLNRLKREGNLALRINEGFFNDKKDRENGKRKKEWRLDSHTVNFLKNKSEYSEKEDIKSLTNYGPKNTAFGDSEKNNNKGQIVSVKDFANKNIEKIGSNAKNELLKLKEKSHKNDPSYLKEKNPNADFPKIKNKSTSTKEDKVVSSTDNSKVSKNSAKKPASKNRNSNYKKSSNPYGNANLKVFNSKSKFNTKYKSNASDLNINEVIRENKFIGESAKSKFASKHWTIIEKAQRMSMTGSNVSQEKKDKTKENLNLMLLGSDKNYRNPEPKTKNNTVKRKAPKVSIAEEARITQDNRLYKSGNALETFIRKSKVTSSLKQKVGDAEEIYGTKIGSSKNPGFYDKKNRKNK